MRRAETSRLGPGLGKFEIIERLGSGGMGSVYLAYDPELDRRLAVKVLGGESCDPIAPGSTFDFREISPELGAGPGTDIMSHRQPVSGSADDLMVEARAMAQLSHPNVVSIYDVGSSDGQLFIAMELVEGANLRQWLTSERRPRSEIFGAFRQAAAGLAAAHRAGLIHRDFKPDNVLIDGDGAVRVADFGLALDDATRISGMAGVAKRLAGTPGYIAPELLAGGRPTPTSDVYAFCVALLEALGGTRPTTALELAETKSVVRGLGRLPSKLRAGLARGLCANPTLRPADGAGLVAMLQKKHAARTTLIAVAALASIGGAAVAFAATRGEESACHASWQRLDASWNPARVDEIRQQVASLNVPNAEDRASAVVRDLELGAERLRAAHRDVCLASERGEIADAEAAARNRCVDEALANFEALGDALSGTIRTDDIDRIAKLTAPARFATNCQRSSAVESTPNPEKSLALRREWERLQLETKLGNQSRKEEYEKFLKLLERAEARVDTKLWPELLYAKAELQWDLKLKDPLETLRAAASAAAKGRNPQVEIRATNVLAKLALDSGRTQEAKSLLAVLKPVVADLEGVDRARYDHHRARVLMFEKKPEEAFAVFREALATLSKDAEVDDAVQHDIYVDFAGKLATLNRDQEAFDLRAEHSKIELARHGLDHRHTLQAQGIQGASAISLGRVDEGLKAMDAAIDGLGREGTEVGLTFQRALVDRKAHALRGVRRFRESLVINERILGDPSISARRRADHLIGATLSHKELLEGAVAAERARELIEIQTKRFGEEHPAVAYAWSYLGQAERTRSKLDKALEAFEVCKRILTNIYGAEHRAVLALDRHFAFIASVKGNYKTAKSLYAAMLSRAAKDPTLPILARGYQRAHYARALLELGELDEAVASFEVAFEEMAGPQVNTYVRGWHRFQLARAHEAKGDRARARELARTALEEVRGEPNPNAKVTKADKVRAWLKKHPAR